MVKRFINKKEKKKRREVMMSKKIKLSVSLMVLVVLVSVMVLSGCKSGVETATTGVETTAKTATEVETAAEVETTDEVVAGSDQSPFMGSIDEKYYMVTFLSGAAFWIGCYKGFTDGAAKLGVSTEYAGPAEYDVSKQITQFEQILALQPAGIALCPMNPEPFKDLIDEAVESGIKIVCFATDSPESKQMSFIADDNVKDGYVGADAVAKVLDNKGDVGIMVRPGQLNLEQRVQGFKERLEAKYPDIKIVATANGGGDEGKAAKEAGSMIQANATMQAIFVTNGVEAIGVAAAVKESGKDIKVFCFDADEAVLDLIKQDAIYACLAPNTYNLGFYSILQLYLAQHDLVNPISDWKQAGRSPLAKYIDTGIDVVYKETADLYYSK